MNSSLEHLSIRKLALLKKILVFFVLAILFLCFLFFSGYRWNLSNSYPSGIYKLEHSTEKVTYKKGDLVLFCPPNNEAMQTAKKRDYDQIGFCEGGFAPVIKRIYAQEGDQVSLRKTIWINNIEIKDTIIQTLDSKKRALPQLKKKNFKVQKGNVFLISDFAPKNSFDSRYFGTVKIENIKQKINPVWIY